MKRRLREAYRKITDSMRENTGDDGRFARDKVRAYELPLLSKWYAAVLVIKEGALTASWSDICVTMEKAFLEAARRYG